MSTRTKMVTLNPAFLQEIKEDHQDLWVLLSEVHALCSSDAWRHVSRRDWAERFARLRDYLAMHFALEEAFGYFEDALVVAPQLSIQAQQLRAQHSDLYQEIAAIADDADRVLHGEAGIHAAKAVVARFNRFHEVFEQHEAEENGLILAAFNVDVGGSG